MLAAGYGQTIALQDFISESALANCVNLIDVSHILIVREAKQRAGG